MLTDQLVEKALQVVMKGGGNYQYFFAKLNSPDWIEPLRKRGRFSHPPAAIVEKNSVRFPGWPEGEYLIRMASLAPEAVFAAIDAKSYESDNHYVHQILLQIAAELPLGLAAEVALAEAKWSSKQQRFHLLYEDKVVPVILKLLAGGRSDAALVLLDPVLKVEAAPERTQEPDPLFEDLPLRTMGTPVARIDPWNARRLLLQVSKPLADAAPENFLALISETLDVAVQIYVNERSQTEDWSFIWRPRVDSDQLGDLMDTLVSVTRDAAVQVALGGGHEIVLRVLGKHHWPIFRRLEYYALAPAGDLPTNLLDRLASEEMLYEDPKRNPEFNDFLSKFATRFSDDVNKKLLAMVDSGPDLGKYSKYLDAQGAKREETERWITDEWRLGWLIALRSIAGDERLKQLDRLLEKYGPPRPAFSVSSVHAVGHLTPISLEDLKKLSIPDLVAYLRAWTPPPRNQPEVPSRAGIGSELQKWVSEDPAHFSDELACFQVLDLHPTYMRSILDGFIGALKSEQPFDPYGVAATIEWVLTNTRNVGPEHFEWDEDPGWSWAHMSSARFLNEVFLHPDRLDTSRHAEFWPALKLIAENSSPTDEDEAKYRKDGDFGMLALNSARPVGLEAVMRYARWLKLSATSLKVNAQGMPDVFNLLAAHLDPTVDSSVAVREIYGMQFGLLTWLDRDWWEQQLPKLFPEGGKLRHLDHFAWKSYLQFSGPFITVLPAMRFRYQRAIDALQPNATEVHDDLRSLGNHIMQYYAAGAIQLEDTLITQFFAKASPALRAQTVGDVGWHLRQQRDAELDPIIQKRLMDFWEYRLSRGMARVISSREEMGGFGWWFASKKFPDDWAIRQIVAVMETFRNITPDFAVVKRLAEVASVHPYEAVRCLGILLEEDRDGWSIHGWADSPQIIINEALRADQRSRAEAERVTNLLVARGHRGFRDFLKS